MDRVPSFLKKSAKRIAKEAVEATLKGKQVYVPTKTYKLIVFLIKTVPQSIFSLLSSGLAPGRYDKK
jgi:short-subunit dehydrogenase